MQISSLGKDLNIIPFRCRLVEKDNTLFFEWGGGKHKFLLPLHYKFQPYMKCINTAEKIYQVSNAHIYFINRNRFVMADDRKKSNKDLVLAVSLNLRKDHKGKCIMVGNETQRLFYDHKFLSKKIPDFCIIKSFIFVKDGETAKLIDYLLTGEYSEIIIKQDDSGWWTATRENIHEAIPLFDSKEKIDIETSSSEGEMENESISSHSEN